MTHIPNTTLCCIDCLNHDAALEALRASMQQCQFDRVIFISDRPTSVEGIEGIQIPAIRSSQDYSAFVLKKLVDHITTEHVLLVQWDGFIVSERKWNEEYLNYDYIGAPWPWEPEADQVGNGGFSLRSKKLLEALQDPRAVSQGPEDEDICKRFRPWLESDYGIHFAPAALARHFSYERGAYTGERFGFHGMFNMHRYLDSGDLKNTIDKLPEASLSNPEAMELAINLVRNNDLETANYLLKSINKGVTNRVDVEYLLHQCEKFGSGLDVLDITRVLQTGHDYQQRQDMQTALQLFQLATLIDPQHPEPNNLIGMLCIEVGQTENALQFFKKASTLQPGAAMYHKNIAYTFLELGKEMESIAYFERALELDPHDANTANDLAAIAGG